MNNRLTTATIDSPLGPLLLGAIGESLCLLAFANEHAAERQTRQLETGLHVKSMPGRSSVIDQAEAELAAYFAGELTKFTTPIRLLGTPFQQRIWTALRRIPPGETRSYGAIARAVGHPHATRAVGTANGANRIAIIVACHRVVRSGGALGGYAGGLDRKRWLLEHELAPALFV